MHPSLPSRAARLAGAALLGLGLTACNSDRLARPGAAALSADRIAGEQDRNGDPALRPLDHIVVIYLENHSFDNLYGEFPGADGLGDAEDAPLQVDATGTPYATLPAIPSKYFPTNLPNAPFNIEQYVPATLRRSISCIASTRSRRRSTTGGWTSLRS
jgi:phospholipase C